MSLGSRGSIVELQFHTVLVQAEMGLVGNAADEL